MNPDALQRALLAALAEETTPQSVPRLGKRLGQGASVVMRALTLMGSSALGGQAGPGWVQVELVDERWMAALTEEGRRHVAQHLHA
ncbi:hypothetical protein [Rhodoferax saidenbachensis]|uniref:FdhD protein n=1 Tax=Rhodoferax saidenbachensis TaxID=1484693 RepID=A0A1P8KCT9_9BURK|nr:hypothetical protein [Rhodoferax saidenbachensis]APW43821.1 hypothetical protein RS694_15625 [Rhodoferax saidenbachensis]